MGRNVGQNCFQFGNTDTEESVLLGFFGNWWIKCVFSKPTLFTDADNFDGYLTI